MEDKKYIKITLGTAITLAIMFILIICGLIFGFYYYNLNNQEQNKNTNSINNNVNESEEEKEVEKENNNEIIDLKLGVYITKEIEVTPDPETYGIHDITLENDSNFSINMPLGTSYKGIYMIEENKLICNATQEEIVEGGNSLSNNVSIEFEFEIIDESKLKFNKVSNKDFELTLGMIYAIESEKNSNSKYNQNNQYKQITSELEGIDVLYVTDVINNNNTYTLKGVIYTQYTLTEEELNSVIKEGTMKINDVTYNIKDQKSAQESGTYNPNALYTLYEPNTNHALYFIKQKNNNEYYLESTAQISDVWKLTDEYREITLSGDVTCITGYPEEEESTLKEEFKNFKESTPIDTTNPYSGNTYRFTFENGKCTKVINATTSM